MAAAPLVSTDWLAAHARDRGVVIVDSRWYLDPNKRGQEAYDAGHIPGAIFMDLDSELAAPGGKRGGLLGRHPWPPPEQVEAVMGRQGIDETSLVVAYDDQAGAIAARLWYVLRAHGHQNVAVLDGGIAKWIAEGRPLATDVPAVEPKRFIARPVPRRIVTKEEVAALEPSALVIDVRAGERYRGEQEPIDTRAGHIPGAVNVPYASNLTGGVVPVMRSPEELRALYRSQGAADREAVVYCGSGVTSCHTMLALELAGLPGILYPGSWSEWSSDPRMPVASGGE